MKGDVDERGVEQRIGALGGEITFAELFPDDWIDANTEFADARTFIVESGFDVSDAEDFAAVPDREWNTFVARNTEFADWEEMLERALEVYVD